MNGDAFGENAQACLTMAAGSDRKPIESPIVPNCGKPMPNSLIRLPGVRNHIPYSDHNYGKPLTPPDSCSPDHPAEEVDTANEDEGFTRCICGFKHDDGYMICCDKCSAWQHVECVGIKSNSVPDTYLCDLCDPRQLDRERAFQIQLKKTRDMSELEDEEDGDVSEHDSDNVSSRVPLPPNSASSLMKENLVTKGKRKKRESTRKMHQKEMKHSKRKRRKKKHMPNNDAIPVDEDANGPWNIAPFPDRALYEEADKTEYIGELMNQSFPPIEPSFNLNMNVKTEQLCKVVDVQRNKKGVVLTGDLNKQQFILECKGKLMLESKFKEDHPVFARCDPYIMHYLRLGLVMDFSEYGNDARFIRRSCSPTAEVGHVILEGKPHLIVVSITPLGKGAEVTLAFEFPFQDYRRQLECACAQENCEVLKHNRMIQRVEQANGYRSSKDELGCLDSSQSNHMDSDSDGDQNSKRNRAKMSREDRKMQQIMRQFEKMENKKKKKQHGGITRETGSRTTGILTQRNHLDEINGETPSKASKGIRKQGLSQRHQRKIHALRRGQHRLTSCSSEPLSPEDHFSSTASTPTTPYVNAMEEHQDEQHYSETTHEKSFKFPKFKKGSITDVSSNVDASRNDPSLEASLGYPIPMKSSFESRIDIGESTYERLNQLHAVINGNASPRSEPVYSPSPSHSTYASPTHSECADMPEMFSRHHLASPTGSLISSSGLNSALNMTNPASTTLKKRWLLQYGNQQPCNKTPPAYETITTSVYRPSLISKRSFSSTSFPLPFKRRKLMEYKNRVQNSSLASPLDENHVSPSSECASSSSVETISTAKLLTVSAMSPVTSQLAMTSLESSSVISTNVVSSQLATTSDVTSINTSSPLTSVSSDTSTSTVTAVVVSNHQTSVSMVTQETVSKDTARPHVTGSDEVISRRLSGGSDDTNFERSSVLSISSTDDVKTDLVSSNSNTQKTELINVGDHVGSSSEVNREASLLTPMQRTNNSTVNVTSDDVGVTEGLGVVSTTQTTPGGKKKVSLSEYLNRKRTTGLAIKRDITGSAITCDVATTSLSRVIDSASAMAINSNSVSSAVERCSPSLGVNMNHTGYGSTLMHGTTGVSSSTNGVMIEPVSPDDGSRFNNERPVEKEIIERTSIGNSSDAMDIEDDDNEPSSSTSLIDIPTGARPIGVSSSDMVSSLTGTSYSYIGQHPTSVGNMTPEQPSSRRQVLNAAVPTSLMPADCLGRSLSRTSITPNVSQQPQRPHITE